jgi:tetratricopeptide (TPR) repeat protein/tRNA A-37 threonylcarbamoyl transferase component Bud32
MHCPRCGRTAASGADRCAFCGTPFAGAGRTGDTATGALSFASEDATATGATPPPDPDATVLTPPPADPDETRIEASPLSDTQEYFAADTAAPRPPNAAHAFAERAQNLVGKSLGTRYQIIKMLGAGGMGAVYQAWDADLSVVVALKTVRPEVTADPETARQLERRFKQELLLARQVTHKNIVRVHDMGEVDGIKYITMPYIEGEDLSTVLKRDGKLPVERVMPIAKAVVSGLVAAHAAGVVHRDLKPANIMLQAGGEPLITDFGVARSTSSADAPAGGAAVGAMSGGQTVAGTVVGSVPYMAPEQAKAQPVDQRADIYAFGLILYDLLAGPTRSKSVEGGLMGELTQRMQKAPAPLRSIDPSIPEPLDALITKCLQPDPASRPQTSADLAEMLDRLDDHGKRIHIARRLTWKVGVGAMAVVAGLLGLTYWAAQSPAPPVQHEPVSVLVADFQNTSGDATFDRTLEPVMQLALEGAGFITALDRAGVKRLLGETPPEKLDEAAALEIAVKQGLNHVIAASVARQGSRYQISARAIQAVTGTVVTTRPETASRKEDVLGAVTRVAGQIRESLGDTESESERRFKMETLSSRSIEAVREYAKGMEGFSRNKSADALKAFAKAAELDPGFGMAYGGMAIASRNLNKHQDAVNYANQAMQHLDGMTERERFRARALYYYITSDYQTCRKEYGDLIVQYSADPGARNNRALCLTYLRELPTAIEEMKAVIKILPNRALYRENLALYQAYNGDFAAAEEEVRAMTEPGMYALLARAFAELGQGRLADAAKTYAELPKADPEGGPSYAASGLGDLAIHEGRYADAVRILTPAAVADEKANTPDSAANKYVAIGYAQLSRGQKGPAIAAADKALTLSTLPRVRLLAGRILIEAGASAKAEKVATGLAAELLDEPQAYALILEGLRALSIKNHRLAIKHLTDANTQFKTWLGTFDLGRAYLAAGQYPQADSEFDRCLKQKGEALTLFLDEEPAFGYFPAVLYYQGLVRAGLKNTTFTDSFKAYLQIRGASKEDALASDARKRVSQK